MIEKMETVKKKANIKKKFNDEIGGHKTRVC
jgi:hypothetical protein